MEEKVFGPIDVWNKTYHLRKYISVLKNELHVNVDELECAANEADSVIEWNKKKCLEYISKTFGKFVKITTYYKSPKSGDNSWKEQDKLVMMPYRLNMENGCLFGVGAYIDNDYQVGGEEMTFHLFDQLQKRRVAITEITKEEYIGLVYTNFNRVLQNRINKINSDNYVLTDCGYIFKDKYRSEGIVLD